MNRAAAVLLALMMTSVTLAGCTGDDTTIQELEAAALQDQQKIEQLNSSIANSSFQIVDLQSQISALNSLIVNLNMQIFSLDENLTSEEEASESLQQQVDSLQATKEELLSEKAALEAQLANEFQMGYAQGVADASSDGSAISTLDLIHERGTLKCGVKESQWGMGYLDWETGVRSGLDIEYCRALAAAIGLNPDTGVEYVLASGSNRFNLLSDGEIDVLIRTTTWTGSRDADLDADFAAVNFYDGQGMLIRGDMVPDDGAYSPADLEGLSVCVGVGTTSEGNLAGWAETNGVTITSVSVQDSWEAVSKLVDGECSA
ncbi:MAG: transporter substrate-binding domain-containing protein, partial [Candidatus Thermoplasmatota archaeon]|nr:transporter substrate-binding domain-containing protein [Candidatus Thermoplasmatota archaeon]